MDVRKIFIPRSIVERNKRTTRAKDNVEGTIYNDAISFVKILQKALLTKEVRTNLVTIIRSVINNDGSYDNAAPLEVSAGTVLLSSTTDGSSVVLSSGVTGQTTTIKNESGDANIAIYPLSGQTLNGTADATVLSAGGVLSVTAYENDWVIL